MEKIMLYSSSMLFCNLLTVRHAGFYKNVLDSSIFTADYAIIKYLLSKFNIESSIVRGLLLYIIYDIIGYSIFVENFNLKYVTKQRKKMSINFIMVFLLTLAESELFQKIKAKLFPSTNSSLEIVHNYLNYTLPIPPEAFASTVNDVKNFPFLQTFNNALNIIQDLLSQSKTVILNLYAKLPQEPEPVYAGNNTLPAKKKFFINNPAFDIIRDNTEKYVLNVLQPLFIFLFKLLWEIMKLIGSFGRIFWNKLSDRMKQILEFFYILELIETIYSLFKNKFEFWSTLYDLSDFLARNLTLVNNLYAIFNIHRDSVNVKKQFKYFNHFFWNFIQQTQIYISKTLHLEIYEVIKLNKPKKILSLPTSDVEIKKSWKSWLVDSISLKLMEWKDFDHFIKKIEINPEEEEFEREINKWYTDIDFGELNDEN